VREWESDDGADTTVCCAIRTNDFLGGISKYKLKSRFLMKTAVFNMLVFNASEPAERT
jgi:hypothetical protein